MQAYSQGCVAADDASAAQSWKSARPLSLRMRGTGTADHGRNASKMAARCSASVGAAATPAATVPVTAFAVVAQR
jgi:hypothetical protein